MGVPTGGMDADSREWEIREPLHVMEESKIYFSYNAEDILFFYENLNLPGDPGTAVHVNFILIYKSGEKKNLRVIFENGSFFTMFLNIGTRRRIPGLMKPMI